MGDQLKRKRKEQEAEPALFLPATRQPSGYSSASFYNLSSLPSSTESTSSSEFEYSSPSESSSFLDDTSAAHSERSSASLSLESVVSSSVRTKPSAGSSANTEYCLSVESGPTLEKHSQVASGDASSLGHSSGIVVSDSLSLSWDGGSAATWPTSPHPSGTASPNDGHNPILSSPASSLVSGPSELPQRANRSDSMSQLSSEDESDVGGPVRFVVYSPQITLKDWRGDCSCWQEKKKLL